MLLCEDEWGWSEEEEEDDDDEDTWLSAHTRACSGISEEARVSASLWNTEYLHTDLRKRQHAHHLRYDAAILDFKTPNENVAPMISLGTESTF